MVDVGSRPPLSAASVLESLLALPTDQGGRRDINLLFRRLLDIRSFYEHKTSILEDRRRRLKRAADKLHKELDGLNGIDASFAGSLDQFRDGLSNAVMSNEKTGSRHSAKTSVLRMAIRLYIELARKSGFSLGGPMVAFANFVGELVLEKPRPFSENAVAGVLKRLKLEPGFSAPTERPYLRRIR
jgi:hypothetical protein